MSLTIPAPDAFFRGLGAAYRATDNEPEREAIIGLLARAAIRELDLVELPDMDEDGIRHEIQLWLKVNEDKYPPLHEVGTLLGDGLMEYLTK